MVKKETEAAREHRAVMVKKTEAAIFRQANLCKLLERAHGGETKEASLLDEQACVSY
jgi:hypothetical protein